MGWLLHIITNIWNLWKVIKFMFQTTKPVKPICYTQRTSRSRNVSNVLRVAGTCWATSWILEAESKRKAPITWDRRRLKPRGRRGGDMFGEVNWDMLRSCFGTSVFDRFILSIYFRGQSLLLDVCFGIFVWRVTLSHVQKAMGHHSEGVSLLESRGIIKQQCVGWLCTQNGTVYHQQTPFHLWSVEMKRKITQV